MYDIAAKKLLESGVLSDEQKALLERGENNTLVSQESIASVRGSDQRNVLMRKLMRREKSSVIVLK